MEGPTPTASRAARSVAGALAAFALLASACDASIEIGGVDLEEVEAKLVDLQEETSPNLAVGEAACPDDLDEINEGDTFECTVTIEGVEAPYAVTLTDEQEDSDVGSFDFKPAKPIIDVSLVVDFVRSRLNERSQGAEVDCGDAAVIVTEVGGTFDCTVSDSRGSETVSMVVKNIDGDVGFAD
jgi:hypothetical protein